MEISFTSLMALARIQEQAEQIEQILLLGKPAW